MYQLSQMISTINNDTNAFYSYILPNKMQEPWETAETNVVKEVPSKKAIIQYDEWHSFKNVTGNIETRTHKIADDNWLTWSILISMFLAFAITLFFMWIIYKIFRFAMKSIRE